MMTPPVARAVSNGATAVPRAELCNILVANCPLTVRVTHKHHAPVKLSHSEKFVP